MFQTFIQFASLHLPQVLNLYTSYIDGEAFQVLLQADLFILAWA